MDLNIVKCSIITFTRKKNVFKFDYGVTDQILNGVVEVKDLGIIIDSKLTFDKHVNYFFHRCNKLLGFIFRACRRFKSKKSIMFLYNSLIRSLCEYGSEIRTTRFTRIKSNRFRESTQDFFTRSSCYANLNMRQSFRTSKCRNCH